MCQDGGREAAAINLNLSPNAVAIIEARIDSGDPAEVELGNLMDHLLNGAPHASSTQGQAMTSSS